MTVPQAGGIPRNLYLVIDLGSFPRIQAVSDRLTALDVLWDHCLFLTSDRYRSYSDYRQAVQRRKKSRDRDYWSRPLVDTSELRIRRMSLDSPWEVLLTVAAERSEPIMYGGAAIVAMDRLLKMLMDWQRHRMDMSERRAGLSGPGEVVREHRMQSSNSDESHDRSATSAASVLADAPIVRAELQDESGPAPDQRVDPQSVINAARAAGLELISRAEIPPFLFLLVFGPRK